MFSESLRGESFARQSRIEDQIRWSSGVLVVRSRVYGVCMAPFLFGYTCISFVKTIIVLSAYVDFVRTEIVLMFILIHFGRTKGVLNVFVHFLFGLK